MTKTKTDEQEPISEFTDMYSFLSNFYRCAVPFMGRSYLSVEHAYQAAKTLDPEQRLRIKSAKSPNEAKKLGRKVKLRADWKDIKIPIMRELLYLKFHPYWSIKLYAKLQETAPRQLVEGNTWGDTFWGVDAKTGKGANHLGLLLMEIRDEVDWIVVDPRY